MPMTVITVTNVPLSLRGDLTKWMQEIAVGVYIGNFNSKVRDQLWQRVTQSVEMGQATISYAYRNEIGYQFQTYMAQRKNIDYEGIPLVLIPAEDKPVADDSLRNGFSNAAKFRQAQKFAASADTTKASTKGFVVIDVVTDGKDGIIEIAAVKADKKEDAAYSRLIQYQGNLPEDVRQRTGITEEMLRMEGMALQESLKEFVDFVGSASIVGYIIDDTMALINKALAEFGETFVKNNRFDIRKLVKKEKMFLADYQLESILKAYDIKGQVSNRALADAELLNELVMKVNKF